MNYGRGGRWLVMGTSEGLWCRAGGWGKAG